MDQKHQIDRILAVVEETNRRLGIIEGKVSGLDEKVSHLSAEVSGITEQVAGLSEWRTTTDNNSARMLSLLLDTRERVERLETGFGEVKLWKNETLNKLDGFLVILDRHESEIAALGGLWQQQAKA